MLKMNGCEVLMQIAGSGETLTELEGYMPGTFQETCILIWTNEIVMGSFIYSLVVRLLMRDLLIIRTQNSSFVVTLLC